MSKQAGSGGAVNAGPKSGTARRERPAVVAYFNPGSAPSEDTPEAAGARAGDAAGDHIYPDDIDEWAERLAVTPEQLRTAIRRVGARAEEVERYLGNPDVV